MKTREERKQALEAELTRRNKDVTGHDERRERNPNTGFSGWYPITTIDSHFNFGVRDNKRRLLGMDVRKVLVHFPEKPLWYVETHHTRNGRLFRSSGAGQVRYHATAEECDREVFSKLEKSLKKAANFGTGHGYK